MTSIINGLKKIVFFLIKLLLPTRNKYGSRYFMCEVDPSNPDTVPKFVDHLPIPPVLEPVRAYNGAPYYELEMKQVKQQLHSFFPPTEIWGYEGKYPGPTIETMRDQKAYVKWINNLPSKHLLPIDRTLHLTADTPDVRTVVHLHGANVSPESDGHPEAWFTKNYRETGKNFSTKIYKYTNHQNAATLWYHDLAIGITRLNVYAGLAGFYIIRDALESRLELPSGQYEIPILIQDRSFNKDGSLSYPAGIGLPIPDVMPSVLPSFIGNTILVNGKVWPHLNVEPKKYRFRMLNGSNTRTYIFRLSTGQSFYQIGSDGGLLEKTVEIKTLTLGPAERADVIIDFSEYWNQKVLLASNDNNPNTRQIMQFRVAIPAKGKDTAKIPETIRHLKPIKENLAEKTRNLTINTVIDEHVRDLFLLDNKRWDDPVSQKPRLDTIEIWNFINLTPFAHPIHVHLVQFRVLDRRPFDIDYYRNNKEIKYTGDPILPDENERGLKDTVRAEAGQVTRIALHFGDFAGDYVWHSHILEHEDYDMMRPFKVVPECCGNYREENRQI